MQYVVKQNFKTDEKKYINKKKKAQKSKKKRRRNKKENRRKIQKKKEIEILKELFLIVSNGFAEKSLCRTAKGFKRLENTQEN